MPAKKRNETKPKDTDNKNNQTKMKQQRDATKTKLSEATQSDVKQNRNKMEPTTPDRKQKENIANAVGNRSESHKKP